MPKFMYLYNGPATDMSEMTEEQGKAVMEKWGVWTGKVGSALTDVGTPLGNGAAVVDNGSKKDALQISGYSIVEADNLETAMKLADAHPFLSDQSGKFSVEIFEMLPTPEM